MSREASSAVAKMVSPARLELEGEPTGATFGVAAVVRNSIKTGWPDGMGGPCCGTKEGLALSVQEVVEQSRKRSSDAVCARALWTTTAESRRVRVAMVRSCFRMRLELVRLLAEDIGGIG